MLRIIDTTDGKHIGKIIESPTDSFWIGDEEFKVIKVVPGVIICTNYRFIVEEVV